MLVTSVLAQLSTGLYEFNNDGINTPLLLGSTLLTSPLFVTGAPNQTISDKTIVQWIDDRVPTWLCPQVDLGMMRSRSLHKLGYTKIGMMLDLKRDRDFW